MTDDRLADLRRCVERAAGGVVPALAAADLLAEVDAMREVLARFLGVEEGRCEVKGGFCYRHDFDEPCPVGVARALLGRDE